MIGTDWNSFSDENYEYLWEGEDLYIYEMEQVTVYMYCIIRPINGM